MKHFKFGKLLMMFALVIIIQNGAITVQYTSENTGAYSEEDQVSPLSDVPYPTDTES